MSNAVKGKSLADVLATIESFKEMMMGHESTLNHDVAQRTDSSDADLRRLGELAALQGVVKFPVRIKCATLSWNTLLQGLDELSASGND
jgi:nitrogen fixation NifU-like protein